MSTQQRSDLQYISDNSPTRKQLFEQYSPDWILRVWPLKARGHTVYDPVANQWTITAAGTAALAS